MFLKVFEDHNREMEALVEKEEYSPATLERFMTAKNFVIDFLQVKYGVQDVNIYKPTFNSVIGTRKDIIISFAKNYGK
jgi:hypothetical protein